jgi:hypothetical protein
MARNNVNTKQARLERFQNMGIPQPITSYQPEDDDNINMMDDTRSKIKKIQSGALREQFSSFVKESEKGGVSSNLPISKAPTNPNVAQKPKEMPGANFRPTPIADRSLNEAMQYESKATIAGGEGSDYFSKIKKNLEEKAKREGAAAAQESYVPPPLAVANQVINENLNGQAVYQQPPSNTQPIIYVTTPPSVTPQINLGDENLIKLIKEEARKMAIDVFKKLLSNANKNGITIINESATVKKAEFVEKNVVKIGGKTYKITPLT